MKKNWQRQKPDPQVKAYCREVKFTMFPNPLLEAVMNSDSCLGKNQMQLALAILRLTFGHQQFANRISNAQLQKMTGLEKRTISRNLSVLRHRHIVAKSEPHSWKQGIAAKLGLGYNPDDWMTNKPPVGKSTRGVTHPQRQGAIRIIKRGQKLPPFKESRKKKTIKDANPNNANTFLRRLKNDSVSYMIPDSTLLRSNQ